MDVPQPNDNQEGKAPKNQFPPNKQELATTSAIASTEKGTRFRYEPNLMIRNRIEKKLLNNLRQILNEYTRRVGEQAVVMVVKPGQANCTIMGSNPLKKIMENKKQTVHDEMVKALYTQELPQRKNQLLFKLPQLVFDDEPTPVYDMTMFQLRRFIPLMMKYATGKGKPHWGDPAAKPLWWPGGVAWSNIRTDTRQAEEKDLSWSDVLRLVVVKCYVYHAREDLLRVAKTPMEAAYIAHLLRQEKCDKENQDPKLGIRIDDGPSGGKSTMIVDEVVTDDILLDV